jgi:hypothetical protein
MVTLILAILLSEGSTLLLDLPNFDELDFLSLLTDLFFGLFLFVVFHLLESCLSTIAVILSFFLAIVVGAVIIWICLGWGITQLLQDLLVDSFHRLLVFALKVVMVFHIFFGVCFLLWYLFDKLKLVVFWFLKQSIFHIVGHALAQVVIIGFFKRLGLEMTLLTPLSPVETRFFRVLRWFFLGIGLWWFLVEEPIGGIFELFPFLLDSFFLLFFELWLLVGVILKAELVE